MPNVVMEAMANNVPVVATNAGGTGELVKDGENGFLCEINNTEEIYQKLKQLIENDKLRQKFIDAAYQTIADRFTFKQSIDKLEQALFNKIEN